jgi:hypothetical protein
MIHEIKFKHLFFFGVLILFIYLLTHNAFGDKYRVIGDYQIKNKTEGDTLSSAFDTLKPILSGTAKKDFKQWSEDKITVDKLKSDIVFNDETEARNYYTELKKQLVNGQVSLHLCHNSEYGGNNAPCTLEQSDNLSK